MIQSPTAKVPVVGAPDAVAPTYRDDAVAPVMPAASPIDFTPERVLRYPVAVS